MDDLLFALDIGTRSIVGLACHYDPPNLTIDNYALFEHSSRGMIDGQVQDIDEVARYAKKVKDELVKKVGCDFSRAAIAFAGRSLHSRVITSSLDFPFEQYIDDQIVEQVNKEAVHQGILHGLKLNMYCVGYVRVGYILNDTPVRKPQGHYAHRVTSRILVTFLPREIVNSKIAVLRRLGLEPDIITLEPIAAGDIVFIERIRHLNLLLLDIGAGTTDIAITSGGTVIGYASLPIAGDEITEEISEAYLLDFEAAEKAKRLLSLGETVSFTSVFGKHWTVPNQEVLDRIKPRISKMAVEIKQACEAIFPEPISAIFCVGGGSFTPGICEALESAFGLPLDRIIVPDSRDITGITDRTGAMYGPHWVTPLGIARAVATRTGFSLINIEVNEQPLQALGMDGKITALEAIGLRGFFPFLKTAQADTGHALSFIFNKQRVTIPPVPPRPAVLRINDVAASLDAEITEGAKIFYEAGCEGQDASFTVSKLIEQELASIDIHDEESGNSWHWDFPVELNGEIVIGNPTLRDGDEISIPQEIEVIHILRGIALDPDEFRQQETTVWVGNNAHSFLHRRASLYNKSGAELKLHDTVPRGASLVIRHHPELTVQAQNVIPELLQNLPGYTLTLNDATIDLPARAAEILMNGEPITPEVKLRPGAKLEVREPDQRAYVIADLLQYIPEVQAQHIKGKRLVMRKNNEIVGFDTPVATGDRITIRWE